MALTSDQIEWDGPFTKDQAQYINSRKRLRVEAERRGITEALLPQNWVDEDGNPAPETFEKDERFVAAGPHLTSQPEDRGRERHREVGAGGEVVTIQEDAEAFVPVDRSDWKKDQLKEEIEARNAKIEAYNEEIEDESMHWQTLPKSGNKDELEGVLAQHDRFIYDTKNAPGGDDDASGDDTDKGTA